MLSRSATFDFGCMFLVHDFCLHCPLWSLVDQFGKVVSTRVMKPRDSIYVLRLAMQFGANYVDVELEIAHDFNDSIYGEKPDSFKVIV
ncbi:SHIKIMATE DEHYDROGENASE [Salix koriyanagi]|uniref:SHIKIMATE DEHYDROGENASE n=1 Tax=Salix koriyanagi TaxID=2511006 RepID=A0A9Q1A3W1_9ROSI|nr:SHIKIMATE DEHYDROGENASE [Salix koriyanagi]